MRKELKLTSVKVDAKLFEEFKIECVRRKYTLNKLVNTAIKLYLEWLQLHEKWLLIHAIDITGLM